MCQCLKIHLRKFDEQSRDPVSKDISATSIPPDLMGEAEAGQGGGAERQQLLAAAEIPQQQQYQTPRLISSWHRLFLGCPDAKQGAPLATKPRSLFSWSPAKVGTSCSLHPAAELSFSMSCSPRTEKPAPHPGRAPCSCIFCAADNVLANYGSAGTILHSEGRMLAGFVGRRWTQPHPVAPGEAGHTHGEALQV